MWKEGRGFPMHALTTPSVPRFAHGPSSVEDHQVGERWRPCVFVFFLEVSRGWWPQEEFVPTSNQNDAFSWAAAMSTELCVCIGGGGG
jgi:hypothetical protein